MSYYTCQNKTHATDQDCFTGPKEDVKALPPREFSYWAPQEGCACPPHPGLLCIQKDSRDDGCNHQSEPSFRQESSMSTKTRWRESEEEWDIYIVSKYLPTKYTCSSQKGKEWLHRDHPNQVIRPDITNKAQMDICASWYGPQRRTGHLHHLHSIPAKDAYIGIETQGDIRGS